MPWREWNRGVEIEPSLYAADFANLGAQLEALLDAGVRIFHFDVADPAAATALARELGLGVGVAFNPGTPVATSVAAAEGLDLVLCMSIHPGRSGQSFMPEAVTGSASCASCSPTACRSKVDGGIWAANIADVNQAGADLLVAGSSIFWQGDVSVAYRTLSAMLDAREPAHDRL